MCTSTRGHSLGFRHRAEQAEGEGDNQAACAGSGRNLQLTTLTRGVGPKYELASQTFGYHPGTVRQLGASGAQDLRAIQSFGFHQGSILQK